VWANLLLLLLLLLSSFQKVKERCKNEKQNVVKNFIASFEGKEKDDDDDDDDDDEAVTRLLTATHARRTIKNEFHSARVATKSPQRRVRVKRFIRNRTIDIRSHG